jgi:methylglutaconyl-CoA hydratase
VNEVAADAPALLAARAQISRDILACAPGAVADAKQLATDVFARDIDHGMLEDTARRIAQARVGKEGQEGVRAFLERRKPAWAQTEG